MTTRASAPGSTVASATVLPRKYRLGKAPNFRSQRNGVKSRIAAVEIRAAAALVRRRPARPLGQVAAHRVARQRARGGGIVWLAVVQALRVVEERDEELALIGCRAQREARVRRGDVPPRGAHLVPERVRALAIAARRRIVEALEALVTVEAELLREHRLRVDRPPAVIEHDLQVLLLLHPPGWRDRVTVRANEDVVVLAYRELAPWERTPGRRALPGRDVAEVQPAAVRRVARRVVDLVDGLRPGALRLRGREVLRLPRVPAAIGKERPRLVAPVL